MIYLQKLDLIDFNSLNKVQSIFNFSMSRIIMFTSPSFTLHLNIIYKTLTLSIFLGLRLSTKP